MTVPMEPKSRSSKVFSRFTSRKKSRSVSSGDAAAAVAAVPPVPPMPASVGHSASSAETTALLNMSSSGSGSSYYGGGAELTRSMAEVAIRLDQFFENMDLEGTEADVVSLSRSVQKAECFSNAYLANCQLRSITLGPLDQRILNLAALSVREVYAVANESDTAVTPLADEYTYFEPTNLIEKFPDNFPEGQGIVKAATVRVFDAEDSRENTVVVALRGQTLKRRDWSQGDGDLQIADGFIGDWKTQYTAHAGFLSVARSMAHVIAEKIESVLSQQLQAFTGTKQILVFTGHSAGGAVASLLYAHATCPWGSATFKNILPKFSAVHCITFGSPPVTSPPLPPPQLPNLLLSVCNDGDPIPRGSDTAYYAALAGIYTSPMDESAPTSNSPYSKRKDLPPMALHNAGTVGVLLRDKAGEVIRIDHYANIELLEPNPPPLLSPGGSVSSNGSNTGVGALKGTMQGSIMPNPKAHDMDVYLKRLRLLGSGEAVVKGGVGAMEPPGSPGEMGRKYSVTSPINLIAQEGLVGVSAVGAVVGTSAGAGAPTIGPPPVPEKDGVVGVDGGGSPIMGDPGITIEKLMEISKKEAEARDKAVNGGGASTST